jgi:fermentation-respiration switch protein FrsA (DUF1100 family)
VLDAYFRSELDLDPLALLRARKEPITIIQGANDVQVSVKDAELLAAARPDAKKIVLAKASHLLKDEAARALPQASYTDPTRPLSPGLVDAVAAAAKR